MVKMVGSDSERALRSFFHACSGCWSGMPKDTNFVIYVLIFIWQVFSPANVIFAGVGVLLSVRILSS